MADVDHVEEQQVRMCSYVLISVAAIDHVFYILKLPGSLEDREVRK